MIYTPWAEVTAIQKSTVLYTYFHTRKSLGNYNQSAFEESEAIYNLAKRSFGKVTRRLQEITHMIYSHYQLGFYGVPNGNPGERYIFSNNIKISEKLIKEYVKDHPNGGNFPIDMRHHFQYKA